MGNNSINSFGLISSVGPLIRGAKYVTATVTNIQSGDQDLYTVPAGRKALSLIYFGVGGTSTAGYFEIKISGTYYRISAASTNLGGTTNVIPIGFLLNAGETFAINGQAGGNTGCRCWMSFCEMDISSNVYVARNLALSNGDNTLYTVPAGKTACIINGYGNIYGAASMQPSYFNNSGSPVTVTGYIVPNGGSTGSTTTYFNATSTADAGSQTIFRPVSLQSGDFLVINTNSGTAGQTGWVNYFEM